MKRRTFLRQMGAASASLPWMFQGLPVRAVDSHRLVRLLGCENQAERVLVLIQLHGGNDGLNMFIPLSQYDVYRNHRPLLGIRDTGLRKYLDLDTTLSPDRQLGLHPDMEGIKALYEEGKAHIVQNVSYPENNGSHFRGTDIWLSGYDGATMPEKPDSGWWGRYLDHIYENYPADYPNENYPDPPGLEFGSHIISLGFHRQMGIPMGLTLNDNPNDFDELVSGVGGALPQDFPDSGYGRELKYIVEVEQSTNIYAPRLAEVFNQGSNTPGVEYPETYHVPSAEKFRNQLAPQLKMVARLLSGGSRTRVFLVRLTGFDTHAQQALAGKPSFGNHGALLYHLSGALKAFQDDLKGLGIEDRVLTLTFSEFGRQVGENSNLGTDHGTSAPMLVIGKGVKPGISGNNPDLANIRRNRLVGFDFDYRQIFTTALQDWFGANNGSLDKVAFFPFRDQKLDLINDEFFADNGETINYVADTSCDPTPDPDTVSQDTPVALEWDITFFPNPTSDFLTLRLQAQSAQTLGVRVWDLQGRQVMQREWRIHTGENLQRIDMQGLTPGIYQVQIVKHPASTYRSRVLATTKVVVQP